jgi:hypothetical protein
MPATTPAATPRHSGLTASCAAAFADKAAKIRGINREGVLKVLNLVYSVVRIG